MVNSKQKGKRGELELVHELKDYGFDTERSQQYCGNAGDADLTGLEGIHIECKRVERLNIYQAMEQARNDAKNDIPAVFHRKNGETWKVTMDLADWLNLYDEWLENGKTKRH